MAFLFQLKKITRQYLVSVIQCYNHGRAKSVILTLNCATMEYPYDVELQIRERMLTKSRIKGPKIFVTPRIAVNQIRDIILGFISENVYALNMCAK